MGLTAYVCLFAALTVILVAVSGCSSPQQTGTAAPVLTTPASNPVGTPSTQAAAQPAALDTTIPVHFNDYACIDATGGFGVTYLNPGEKYTVQATSPGSNTVNVNILFLDVNDYSKILEVPPVWDPVQKVWVYAGIVPIVQFNDVTGPQQKTITIKTQGKYYLCADDRKETGIRDEIYQVPVKMIRS